MSQLLMLAAVLVLAAAGLMAFSSGGSRQVRDRVLTISGRKSATVTVSSVERSLIARPRPAQTPLARASAWLGLAPGQLPTRRLPVPAVLGIAGVLGGVIAWQGTGMVEWPLPPILGMAGAAGILRAAYMWELGRNRDNAFKQIPDAVGLMVRAVRAGLPIGEAMRSVAREMPDPTRSEFQRLLAETGIGVPLEKALWGVFERTGLREYAFLSVVIGLQSQTGGSLAEALDNLGDIVRKRVAMAGKARALAAQARASAGILVALPPFAGAAVSVIQPGYLDALFSDPRGTNLLLTAIGMLGMGMLVIRGLIQKSTAE
jgi:tight adherence protein B